MGVRTSVGYIPWSAGEWLDRGKQIVSNVASALGFPEPTYSRYEFINLAMRVMSQYGSDLDLALATVPDPYDPAQAQDKALVDIATRNGVPYEAGEPSRVVLQCSNHAEGDVFLIAGQARVSDGTYEWILEEDVTLDGYPLSRSATFYCAEVGPISAPAGSIDTIVTGVRGWTGVSQAEDASPGVAADTNGELRAKIGRRLSGLGSRSPTAIEAKILQVPGVQFVRTYYNSTLADETVSGRVVPANGFAVWVYPETLTDASKQQICSVLYANGGGNVNRSVPAASGSTGFVGSITDVDGEAHFEGAWYLDTLDIRVGIFIVEFDGDGDTDTIEAEAIRVTEEFFAGLTPDTDIVLLQQLEGLIVSLVGIRQVNVSFSTDGGATYDEENLEIPVGTIAQLDPSTATPIEVASGLDFV